MIAQTARKSRRSGRNSRPIDEYAIRIDSSKHATPSMAASWGRLAARLGWDLEQGLVEEVAPEFHAVARNAHQLKLQLQLQRSA